MRKREEAVKKLTKAIVHETGATEHEAHRVVHAALGVPVGLLVAAHNDSEALDDNDDTSRGERGGGPRQLTRIMRAEQTSSHFYRTIDVRKVIALGI